MSHLVVARTAMATASYAPLPAVVSTTWQRLAGCECDRLGEADQTDTEGRAAGGSGIRVRRERSLEPQPGEPAAPSHND
jgi:hypothetical protein